MKGKEIREGERKRERERGDSGRERDRRSREGGIVGEREREDREREGEEREREREKERKFFLETAFHFQIRFLHAKPVRTYFTDCVDITYQTILINAQKYGQ